MTVTQILQRNVDVAEFGTPVQTIAERMWQRTVGCLVVVNEQREPVGIDRDLVTGFGRRERPYTTRIEEVMTYDLKVVPEDASIEQTLRVMRGGGFRRVPVIDAAGKLVGIVTLDDVLMLLADEFTQARHVIVRETPQAAALGVLQAQA